MPITLRDSNLAATGGFRDPVGAGSPVAPG